MLGGGSVERVKHSYSPGHPCCFVSESCESETRYNLSHTRPNKSTAASSVGRIFGYSSCGPAVGASAPLQSATLLSADDFTPCLQRDQRWSLTEPTLGFVAKLANRGPAWRAEMYSTARHSTLGPVRALCVWVFVQLCFVVHHEGCSDRHSHVGRAFHSTSRAGHGKGASTKWTGLENASPPGKTVLHANVGLPRKKADGEKFPTIVMANSWAVPSIECMTKGAPVLQWADEGARVRPRERGN